MYFNGVIQKELIEKISEHSNIKSIILFGSYACGTPNENSDVDLIAITDEEGISRNFRERMERKNKLSISLIELMRRVPIDLLVYTKDEWNKMVSLRSSFINEVLEKGIILK